MNESNRPSEMSDYETRAWEQSLQRLHEPSAKRLVPEQVREAAGSAVQRANAFADDHLSAQTVKNIVEKGMNGAFELTFVPALQSANIDGALKGYRKKHDAVETIEDIKNLDVKELDRFRRNKVWYVAGSAAQGSAVSLAITGTTVSTTVSGGATAGLVVGALAADAVATLALMGRTVGSVAVRYGYDVRLPEEELFAMGVISLGTTASAQARYAALASLSRLTQQMMRRATWEQLNNYVLVKVLQRVFNALSIKMTQAKLAQVVPFAGVAIASVLNANLTRTLYQRAEDIYRVRFLTDKYGLDPESWLQGFAEGTVPAESSEEVLDIMEVVEEELAYELDDREHSDDRRPD